MIRQGYREVNKNIVVLSAYLGIGRTSLYREIERLGLREEMGLGCEDGYAAMRNNVRG